MTSVSTIHNRRLPPLPDEQRTIVWLPVGQAVVVNGHSALSAQDEARDGEHRLVLRVHLRDGSSFRADTPEDLAHLTTDAIVRRVDSDAQGRPVRVLVEIGEMVAYPHLRRGCAA